MVSLGCAKVQITKLVMTAVLAPANITPLEPTISLVFTVGHPLLQGELNFTDLPLVPAFGGTTPHGLALSIVRFTCIAVNLPPLAVL